jgi:hypothetical protein
MGYLQRVQQLEQDGSEDKCGQWAQRVLGVSGQQGQVNGAQALANRWLSTLSCDLFG